MNGASAATLKRITEAFADVHQDIANEIHADVDEFACLEASTPNGHDGSARRVVHACRTLPAVIATSLRNQKRLRKN